MRFIRIDNNTFLDTKTNHTYLKNKRGQLFLIKLNSTEAQKFGRQVIYKYQDGNVAVLADSYAINSIRRLERREWEKHQLMWYHFLAMIRKEFQCPQNQKIQNEKSGNQLQNLEISICLSAPLRDVGGE